ncbi:retrotransposon protein, putative, ty1-copia subclass [Tanacetum coccineum]
MYVIEQPLPPAPEPVAEPEVVAQWTALYDAHTEIACLMLGSMTPELHRQFEMSYPFDMIQELRSMFEKQAGMKGYVEKLERLGYVLPQDITVGLILNGLTKDFVGFAINDKSPEQGFNRVLKGRGTVVATGRVEQGMIKVGEEIEIMGLMQVSFFSDEEETTSRPKADALFIPRENLSALVIRPLETWPGNASAEKPKGVSSPAQTNGEYTEFASTSHQNGRHTDNGNGTTEFDDVKGIRMATMKEVPPTAYELTP